VKPTAFDYRRPSSVAEAIEILGAYPGAKVISGGQSLIPMLNFRLVEPTVLVDITRIESLQGINTPRGKGLSIGALTRHQQVLMSDLVAERFPVISEAMKHVAHLAIRNKGTIGGSLSHADPAAEWPMMAVLLDAQMHIAGSKGERAVPAQKFFLGALTPDLEEDEILVRVDIPALPKKTEFVFDEFAQRAGVFALCAVAVTLSYGGTFLTGGKKIRDLRIALIGVDETPVRITSAEQLFIGQRSLTEELVEKAATIVSDTINPNSDLHASADYRRHLAYTMTKRSLAKVWHKTQLSNGLADEPKNRSHSEGGALCE
jgi:carbon-monoxide dehydrogenase medium subunit